MNLRCYLNRAMPMALKIKQMFENKELNPGNQLMLSIIPVGPVFESFPRPLVPDQPSQSLQ